MVPIVHETLKHLRTKCGMTQQQVADILNVDRSTYTYYETGKSKPDVEMLVNISRIYNITLDTLVGNSPESVSGMLKAKGACSFACLTEQEQNLILMFRRCEHKEEAIRILKETLGCK